MKLREFKEYYWFLSLIVSAGFLAVFLYLADFRKVLQLVNSADLIFLLAGFVIGNIPVLLSSYSWKITFSRIGISDSVIQFASLRLSCLFLSNITPFGDFGGEPVVSKLISEKYSKPYVEVLPGIALVDTVQNLPFIVFGIAGAALILPFIYLRIELLPVLIFVALLASSIILLLRFSGFMKSISEDVYALFRNYLGMLRELRESPYLGFELASISVASFLLDVFSIFIFSVSLGFGVEFFTLLFVVPLARVANLAPSFGGAGAYEAGFAVLLSSLAGVSMAEAFSLSIVYRTSTTYFGLFAGFWTLNGRGVKKSFNLVREIFQREK